MANCRVMADRLTSEQRSRNMSAIRNKNTGPELFVRRIVHNMGFRFRLHRRDLPGTPDVLLPRHKKAIFIHGCFWHCHKCKVGLAKPASNSLYWENKRANNVRRDKKAVREMRQLGWQVLVVWECEIRNEARVQARIARFLKPKS